MPTRATPTRTGKRAPARRARRAPARGARARASASRPASTSSTRPATSAARAQAFAGRAVLIPVGVALEARDRVAGTVGGLVTATRSRSALERQLDRFERRGDRARVQLEQEVRRTRSRIERGGRSARRGLARRRAHAGRVLGGNVETLTDRVEHVVQNGVDTGMKLVGGAQDRLARVV